jgi:hypothetical protein
MSRLEIPSDRAGESTQSGGASRRERGEGRREKHARPWTFVATFVAAFVEEGQFDKVGDKVRDKSFQGSVGT